ncbi:MAG: hypothetical protein QOE41_4618 [Mycobacterium sp.]|nr:hypothetical protein [Mycobacterium sp.]MDT5135307.1 hypothetical protein [Mycobacterium sp.]
MENIKHVKNVEEVFGTTVKDLRRARGWTQEELAKRLTAAGYPMHQTTVAKMESGTRPTTPRGGQEQFSAAFIVHKIVEITNERTALANRMTALDTAISATANAGGWTRVGDGAGREIQLPDGDRIRLGD